MIRRITQAKHLVTASPLTKVWAIAFEGMLVTPFDWHEE